MTRDTALELFLIMLAALLTSFVMGAAPYVDHWLITGRLVL
tara:strand:- start:1556 stop:1678 length:123 start_codon:yes stop_codon:yes gene_type:complete